MKYARRRRPVYGAGSRGALLRAAVVTALLLAGAGVARPSRAWILERVDRVLATLPGGVAGPRGAAPAPEAPQTRAGAADAAPGAPERAGEAPLPIGAPTGPRVRERAMGAPAEEREAGSAPVRFGVRRGELLLEVDHSQRDGELVLWIAEVESGSARISAGAGGESITPLPGGIRVENSPRSRATYTVLVPSRVRTVRYRIGRGPEGWIQIGPSHSGQPWIWTINLRGAGSR